MDQPVRGIITFAYGKPKYINMAINLAYSLELTNPHVPRAIITDTHDKRAQRYFHKVIPLDPSFGKGLSQKIKMAHYSPFDKTLFIDSDCLVVKDITFLFQEFSDDNVSVIGTARTSGEWLGVNISHFIKEHHLPFLPVFNGGLYYFKKNRTAFKIFNEAFGLVNSYEQLGFSHHELGANEEPLMAYAMAKHHEPPYPDETGKGMYTPIGIRGGLSISVAKGYCTFQKYHQRVYPLIVHFVGNYSETFIYRREVAKLKLIVRHRLPKDLSSILVNVPYNIVRFLGKVLLKSKQQVKKVMLKALH